MEVGCEGWEGSEYEGGNEGGGWRVEVGAVYSCQDNKADEREGGGGLRERGEEKV